MGPVRTISVIVPMLNEARHVGRLVEDLAKQDFSGDVEVIVADGGSDDGSVDVLRAAAEKHGLELTVLTNAARWVSHGLNACVARARGDLIVRLDCHSRYPADYLRLLARAAEETAAWNVGGVVVPEGHTEMERAVACAMDGPFGGIGWTRRAAATGRIETDTVTYGAFRPEAFAQAGGFDESLERNQDDELNYRIRLAGGRIVLDPEITVSYTPRGSLVAAFRQYYAYGRWKVPVMLKHRAVLSGRSMAPAAMVGTLAILGASMPFSPVARRLALSEVALYTTCAAAFGAVSVRRRNERWRLLPRVVAAYPAFHLGYGLGLFGGWLKATRRH